MILISYLFVALVGLSLGVLGGGGSILMVPVLVYLFKVEATLSTTYSLFVVGVTSFMGSLSYMKRSQVDYLGALSFLIWSLLGVSLVRIFLLPAIPKSFSVMNIEIEKGVLTLIVFSVVMIAASLSMLFSKKDEVSHRLNSSYPRDRLRNLLVAFFVGVLTAFIGAGGGFLIVPALVKFEKLPMRIAVGTSLLVISLNSIVGFISSLADTARIDWAFLTSISIVTVFFVFLGSLISKTLDSVKLKKTFGIFVLSVGVFVLIQNVFLKS